jgi:glycosyltransferase involved in cell wall biosynthesis
MGYIDRFLPCAMAQLGHDVHLVTSDVQPYFNLPEYRETYEPFCGPGIVPAGITRRADGVTLHRLPHAWRGDRLRIRGLFSALSRLRPDVVQGFELNCLTSYETAAYQPLLGYSLFLESHIHASVFADARVHLPWRRRLGWAWHRATLGRLVNAATTGCHPISADAADIAIRFFGMNPAKVAVAPLGTDTDLFRPAESPAELAQRAALRARLGFAPEDTVCIYTGRMTRDKGPALLADAISRLRAAGQAIRGLFVGSGPDDIARAIAAAPGCVVHPFVPVDELPALYRCADLAVWPKQESTSQLDAAASGLPLILSNRVQVTERISGNGVTYREGDAADLAERIAELFDPQRREAMRRIGRQRMVERFDWRILARARIADYEAARTRHTPQTRAPRPLASALRSGD